MPKLIDKLVLLALCLLALTFTQVRWLSIVAMLAAVGASSLCGYFENAIAGGLCIAYAALCLFVPEFVLFLPLIVYDCAGRDKYYFRFCWIPALAVCFFGNPLQTASAVSLASGIAFLLHYRTAAQLKTREEFFALTDDTKERATILERKNRELLEKQDYEVRLATLGERNRIAREIHDNVGHLLTRSLLQLGALRVTFTGDDALSDELGQLRGTLSDAMDSIRSSVHDLHDESVDLELQLRALTDGFAFCPVKLRYDAGELPGAVKACFASVVREALSNIAKHSDAASASVTITEHPAFCQLIIEDNGGGKSDISTGGIGLQNMSDRVDALGGVFRAERERGFRIFISVPKG